MPENPYLWLIPLFPLLGAGINGLAGKRRSEGSISAVAIIAIGLSFLLVLRAFFLYSGSPIIESHFPWISAGKLQIDFNYYFDALTAVMALVVTGVGLLIHVYATGYMSGDSGYYRFFAYLN